MYSDRVGRNIPLFVALVVQMFLYVLVYFVRSYDQMKIILLFLGATAGVRIVTSLAYLIELSPSESHFQLTFAVLFANSFMMLLQTGLYHISRNWVPVQMLGLAMSIFAAIGVYLLPESPKFYYATHRYDSARRMLKLIANYNQIVLKEEDVQAIIFDTED